MLSLLSVELFIAEIWFSIPLPHTTHKHTLQFLISHFLFTLYVKVGTQMDSFGEERTLVWDLGATPFSGEFLSKSDFTVRSTVSRWPVEEWWTAFLEIFWVFSILRVWISYIYCSEVMHNWMSVIMEKCRCGKECIRTRHLWLLSHVMNNYWVNYKSDVF